MFIRYSLLSGFFKGLRGGLLYSYIGDFGDFENWI